MSPLSRVRRLTQPHWAFALVLALAVTHLVVFLTLETRKLRNYDVLSFDLVNMHIVCSGFRDFTQGLDETIEGVTAIVQHPLLTLPGLLWLIYPSTFWYVIFTIGFLSAATPVLYLLARDVLGGVAWPLLIVLSFCFHPLTQTLSLIGLQPTSALIFWFFLEILFLRLKRMDLFTVALVCTNLARVNGAPINLLLGISLLLSGNRRFGKRSMLISLPWILFAILATSLANRWTGIQFSTEIVYLGAFGDSIQEALLHLVVRPHLILNHLWTADNLYHMGQFVPVLFLSLLSPVYLFPALIDLAYVLVSSSGLSQIQWVVNMKTALGPTYCFHNNMMSVLPVIYVSAIFGLRRLLKWIPPGRTGAWTLMGLFVLINACHHYAQGSLQAGPIPLAKGFNLRYYTKTKHAEHIDEAWKLVPDGARIKAPWSLQGLHAPRMRKYYHFHYPSRNESYDYLLFDLFAFSYIKPRAESLADMKRYLESPEFGVVYFRDGVVLMKRGATPEQNPRVLAFMDQNHDLLSRNLLNPYILDGRAWDEKGGERFYTETQRVD